MTVSSVTMPAPAAPRSAAAAAAAGCSTAGSSATSLLSESRSCVNFLVVATFLRASSSLSPHARGDSPLSSAASDADDSRSRLLPARARRHRGGRSLL